MRGCSTTKRLRSRTEVSMLKFCSYPHPFQVVKFLGCYSMPRETRCQPSTSFFKSPTRNWVRSRANSSNKRPLMVLPRAAADFRGDLNPQPSGLYVGQVCCLTGAVSELLRVHAHFFQHREIKIRHWCFWIEDMTPGLQRTIAPPCQDHRQVLVNV